MAGLLIVGCRAAPPPAPATPAAPRTVTLAEGTPLKLVLLDELTSGGTQKGRVVRLALAESVGGLPAMSPVTATVAWSRSEGTLGGLTNRPARLTLTLGDLTGPNGESITLSADPVVARDYELNRDNTGRPDAPELIGSGKDETTQVAVQELIAKGQSGGLDARQVGDLARRLGLNETAKIADAGRLNEVQSLIRTVRGGGSIASLAGGGPVAAALELVNLAGDVGHRLGRTLGGRNIRAYPGTEIPAYVSDEATIRVRE